MELTSEPFLWRCKSKCNALCTVTLFFIVFLYVLYAVRVHANQNYFNKLEMFLLQTLRISLQIVMCWNARFFLTYLLTLLYLYIIKENTGKMGTSLICPIVILTYNLCTQFRNNVNISPLIGSSIMSTLYIS
jgi:hypothetical protein